MSIHIALIGKTKEPVLFGFQQYSKISKMYLLHSPDSPDFKFEELALSVKESLRNIGFRGVIPIKIDAFNMNSVINEIVRIAKKEHSNPIYVNITGGTNLMAAAACVGAFIIGATAYYILDTRKNSSSDTENILVELPIPSIPILGSLQETQIRILKKIHSHEDKISNVKLRNEIGITPQKLSYHIKELERKGLLVSSKGWEYKTTIQDKILTKKNNRISTIKLTNAGQLLANIS